MRLEIEGQGFLYCRRGTKLETLQEILTSGPKWAYVASLAEADLVTCAPQLPKQWPEGRAFGTQKDEFNPEEPSGLEVRWQLTDVKRQLYDVNVLTEDADLPLPGKDRKSWQRVVEEVDGLQTREILLWGEMDREYSDDPEWMVARIPRVLKYPIKLGREAWPEDPDVQRIKLRAEILGYDYTVGGVPVATRWAWLRQGRHTEVVSIE